MVQIVSQAENIANEPMNPALNYLSENRSELQRAFRVNIWVSEELEDCYSDGWANVFEKWSSSPPEDWDEISDKFGYSLQAIRFQAFHKLKRLGKLPMLALEDDLINAYEVNRNPNLYDEIEQEKNILIREIQNITTPKEFTIIFKLVGEEANAREVAEEEGYSHSAIRKIKQRLLRKIRKHFGNSEDDQDPR